MRTSTLFLALVGAPVLALEDGGETSPFAVSLERALDLSACVEGHDASGTLLERFEFSGVKKDGAGDDTSDPDEGLSRRGSFLR
jgi:hypothetical protein